MKRTAAALLLIAALGCQVAPEGTVAFVNVSVLPMDSERVLEGQTVVTSLGAIAEMGPSSAVSAPRGAEVIDGGGRYLMPGLTEMHAHLPGADAPPEEVDRILFLFLSNGVTTVRGMLGDATHIPLRGEIESGARLGPTIYAAGPAFRGSSELTAEDARERVRAQRAAGFDLLKILEGLDIEVYDAIADEAKRAGIPFGGHVPNAVGLLDALAAGQGSIDHLDNYLEALDESEENIPALAAATELADATAVPTMALWETFNADVPVKAYADVDGLEYMPKEVVDRWAESQQERRERLDPESGARVIEMRKRMLKALQDEGARIVFGTDAPQIFNVPGFAIHREMRIMAEAGMTPFEILATGTLNAAEHFGNDDFGEVEVGRRADLILLEGNPLTDLSNMARRAGVMVRGTWLPEAEIQARLADLAASSGQ